MEAMEIGQGPLELNQLAKEIEKSTSFVILVRNWKRFGQNLDVNEVKLLELEMKLRRGDIRYGCTPREIIKLWKANKGKHATLKTLHDALVDCDVKDIAEKLVANSLPQDESVLKMIKVIWQSKVITLEELLGRDVSKLTCQKIQGITEKSFHSIYLKPLHLLKEELDPTETLPMYYIPRTLSYIRLTELDSKVFTSEVAKYHVFLFRGISKSDLAKEVGYKAIDTSGNQLNDVYIRFILLECEEDYGRICRKTNLPVHVIQYENKRYFWVKSNKEFEVIRGFIVVCRTNMDEEEFVTRMASTTAPCGMSIADSPGMGKTLTLASLAVKIRPKCPHNTIYLSIVLQEFVLKLDQNKSATEIIAEYASLDEIAKIVLTEMLTDETRQIYLFLDGYDEVMQDKLDSLDFFLRKLLLELKNVKIIVTSRPHLQSRLEIIFNRISCKILPFNESNQIQFLTNYWARQHGETTCERLKSFAELCLAAFETRLTDRDKEVAGIPLQCMMLGVVYAEDAKRACHLKTLDSSSVKPVSFFQMYKRLIELKFSKIIDPTMKLKFIYTHISLAVTLLFPEWEDVFKPILASTEVEVDENALYSIGLVERGPNTPRFVHRTFAEYLLAGFIVQNLSKDMHCIDLLLTELLGRKGMITFKKEKSNLDYCSYKLKHPVIAYFIDMHLKRHFKLMSVTPVLPKTFSTKNEEARFKEVDVCVAITACCNNDLEWIFKYVTQFARICKPQEELTDQYFKTLPHAVIKHSTNVRMLMEVLDFTSQEVEADLSYHCKDDWYSPLHEAASRGKYNMVTYLIQRFTDEVPKLQGLLHICLNGSQFDIQPVIKDKLLIVDMLLDINRGWLEEEDKYGCTPLLRKNVHLRLLKHLLEHGANVNAYSVKRGTVLHVHSSGSSDQRSYTELVKLAFAEGFRLVNEVDEVKLTPLMRAVQEFGSVEDEVLTLFHKHGVNFNFMDMNRNSVLFYALERTKNVDFIKKLLDYGVNINTRDRLGRTAAHKVILNRNLDSNKVLNVFKLLRSKGFSQFLEADCLGVTPLRLAQEERPSEYHLLKSFLTQGS